MQAAHGLRPGSFFVRFLRNPRRVGALCPSSSRLGAAMLRDVDPAAHGVVVEYGVGTGSFTDTLLDRFGSGLARRYVGIEREPEFHELVRGRHAGLNFRCGSVEDVRFHLDEAGLGRPSLIVSGLPLILMPRKVMEHIVREAAELLTPGGTFRTFSYVHSWPARSTRRLRGLMREHFDRFDMSAPVIWNCPPAFVLRGDRLRSDSSNPSLQGRYRT